MVWEEIEKPPRSPRGWKEKFQEALRGMKCGIRGQSSFFVHIFFAALVITTATALDCSKIEWCLLILCIGGVFTTELINSSIETLFHGLDEATRSRWNGCLEIAAGAVMLAALTASAIGLIIFIPKLTFLLSQI